MWALYGHALLSIKRKSGSAALEKPHMGFKGIIPIVLCGDTTHINNVLWCTTPNLMSPQTMIPLAPKWSIPLRWRDYIGGVPGFLKMKTRRSSICVRNLTHQWKERAPILGVSKNGVFGSSTNGLSRAICSKEDTPLYVRLKGPSLLGVCILFG